MVRRRVFKAMLTFSSLVLLIALFSSAITLSASEYDILNSDPCRDLLESYFSCRYAILQDLVWNDEIYSFFATTPDVGDTLTECDILSALYHCRMEQSINLRTTPVLLKFAYNQYEVSSTKAKITFVVTASYRYLCLPTVEQVEVTQHVVLLTRFPDGWLISEDNSEDKSGFTAFLHELYSYVGKDKELLIKRVEAIAKETDEAQNNAFAALLSPFGTIMLFRLGQEVAWLTGDIVNLPVVPNTSNSSLDSALTLFLPLRVLVEHCQGLVIWEEERLSITVYLMEHTITFRQGTEVYRFDGEERNLTAPLAIVHNRTMVPAEVVAEILDMKIYDDGAGLVLFTPRELSASTQLQLQETLNSIYPHRFSQELFVLGMRQKAQ